MNFGIKNIINVAFYIIIISGLISCSNQSNDQQKKMATTGESNLDSSKQNFLVNKGDSLRLIIDNLVAVFPKKAVNSYQNVYKGIYTVNKGVISKTFYLKVNNIIYFTTYLNLSTGNRGYLYAYDTITKKFLVDQKSKKNYLFSYAGIFFISKEKIFSIYRPYFDDHYDSFIINADFYQIINNNFHQIKYITKKGDFLDGDDYTSLIKFYNEGINGIVSSK